MPSPKTTVAYYVSSHGYGHAARACQVMAALPPDVKIIVRTMVEPAFIERESGRKVTVLPGQFDTGVLQTDNRTLNWTGTLKAAARVQKENSTQLMEEVELLRRHRVDLVVSDVASAPLEAARMAGVPSAVIGNFTWVDIFAGEAKSRPEAARLVEIWREQYALATLAIRTPPAFKLDYFRHVTTVEPIARKGKSVRKSLLRHLNLEPQTKLVLLYFGTFGDDALTIPELPKVKFLSMTPMPEPAILIDPANWHFPDVVASVDCVIAKPGYGTTGECMANGTPMVYHPRTEFAEYPILRKAIQEWGGGVQIPLSAFTAGRWKAALAQATQLKPVKVRANGASQAAALLMDLIAEQ